MAVGIDPQESVDMVRAYKEAQGYPWIVAMGNRQTLETYHVISTSIKYAVDRRGIITYQRGYGVGSADAWAGLLQTLVSS